MTFLRTKETVQELDSKKKNSFRKRRRCSLKDRTKKSHGIL